MLYYKAKKNVMLDIHKRSDQSPQVISAGYKFTNLNNKPTD